MGLCTGACLPEQSQPWPLPNIGPDLDSIQLDKKLASHCSISDSGINSDVPSAGDVDSI